MVAGREAVDVEAQAGARGEARVEQPLEAGQVVVGGDLEVALRAGDQADGEAGRLGHRGVVGQRPALDGAMGGEDVRVAEPLGGLGAPQPGAIDGLADPPVGAALEGVADRERRDRAGRAIEGVEHPVDDAGLDRRARGVVNQHPFGRHPGQALEAEAHGVLAGLAAGHGLQQVEPGDRPIVERAVVGVDHHSHRIDRGMAEEGRRAVLEQGATGQRQVLLGRAGAEALAAPGGDDQGGGSRHAWLTPISV